MRPCLVIPVFDHGRELVAVVEELARFRLPCFVIDDGSAAPTRASIAKLAGENDWIRVERFPENRGKGAALKRGFELAASEGHTHAVQLDADGQHDPRALPGFLAALESNPDALVLGVPIFDASVPRVRLWARQLSKALVWAATLSLEIQDPLCGYRGVPLARALRLLRSRPTGDRMEFEPELAVHLYWDGARVISLPTPVSYPAGGVSHFGFWREYPRLALLYARLLIGMLGRLPALLRRRSTPREACA